MKSIIKTNQPEVGHGIAIFDPTTMSLNHSNSINSFISSIKNITEKNARIMEDVIPPEMLMEKLFISCYISLTRKFHSAIILQGSFQV